MEIDYHTTAFIIAGATDFGRIFYYTYDADTNRYDWFPSAITDANLFSSVEDAQRIKKHIIDNKEKYPQIKRIWIEKLTTLPIPEDTVTEL